MVAGSVSIRIVIFILLGWFGLVGRCAATTTHSLKAFRVTGREYVSLAAWAGSKDFKISWAHKETEVTVSNPWAQLVFRVGERKVVINHRSVWMSFPMAMLNDGPYIARLDLNTMLEPLLFPQILAKPVTIKTAMLDPGHGGKDPGNIHGNQPEKHYNLLLAKEIQRRLETIGIKTLLTRTDDTFVELDERPALASRAKADIFISLHYNAAPGNNDVSKGLEVYCLTPAGAYSSHSHRDEIDNRVYPGNKFDTLNAQLAFQIHKGILRSLGGEDRGIRRARLAVLKSAQMPAVLLEGGFLSNPEDARRIYSEKYRRQLAQAIVSGVLAYKRLVERRPAPTPTVEPEPKPAIVKTKPPATPEESSSNISTNHAEPATTTTKGASAKGKAPAKPPGTVASKTTNLVARPAATNATAAEHAAPAAKANGGKAKSPAKPPLAISTNLITRPAATNATPATELAASGTKATNNAKAKPSARPAGTSPTISTNLVTRAATTNAPAAAETTSQEANPSPVKPKTPPRAMGTNSATATNPAPKAASSNSATAIGSTPPTAKSASAKAKPAAKSPGATTAIATNLVTRTAATNAPAGAESTSQEAKPSPTKSKTPLRAMGTNSAPATNSAPKTASTNSAASTGAAPPAIQSASAKAKPAAKSPGTTATISTNLVTRPVSTNSASPLEAGPAARPATAQSTSQSKAAPAAVDP